MKKCLKMLLMFGFLCVLLLAYPDTVRAENLEENTSYTIDLDGDGKKETVWYEITEINNENGCIIYLYVNEKKVLSLSDESALSANISIVDVKKGDKYKEVYVGFYEASDCFRSGRGYRYQNGTLKKVFTLSYKNASSFRIAIMEKQPGDGLVWFASEFYDRYLGQGYVKEAYKISSGKLKSVKKSILNTTADTAITNNIVYNWRMTSYKASCSLKLYAKLGNSSAVSTISTGEVFYLYKIRCKIPGKVRANVYTDQSITHLYVKTASGKKGWIKNPQKSFYKGYYAWG